MLFAIQQKYTTPPQLINLHWFLFSKIILIFSSFSFRFFFERIKNMAEHYEAESNSEHVLRRNVKLSVLTDSIIVGYILWKQIQLDVKKNLSDQRRKRTWFERLLSPPLGCSIYFLSQEISFFAGYFILNLLF